MKQRYFLLFALITVMLLVIEYLLSGTGGYFNRQVIIAGTLVLALISLMTFLIVSRTVDHDNPNRFVRGVMGGTFLKFFLCIIAAGILLFIYKKQLHKPDLFLLMFVYIVYTVVETAVLSKVSKQVIK
jgi:hypothetical protein